MGSIFINYRRGESLKDAQHLATLLAKPFGAKRIFLDVRGIDGGDHWLSALQQQVADSDAMVALIGRDWADLKDENGNRRLDNPGDFVRFEIAQALQRRIPVLPVLLDGASMPKPSQLPPDMSGLTLFQAIPLRTESVVRDAEAVTQKLRILLAKQRPRGFPRWAAALAVAVALVAGVVVGPFVLNKMGLLSSAPASSDAQGAAELVDLRRRLAEAEDAAKKAGQQVAAATQDADKARQERDDLKKALAAALQEREQARKDLGSANPKIVDLQKQLEAALGKLDQAQKDLARAIQDRDQFKAALATATRERDQARSDLDAANRKITDLQKQRDAAQHPADPAHAMTPGSGQSFRDRLSDGQPCPMCPEVVVVPSGSFTMGSPESEPEREQNESPQRKVNVERPFVVGRYAITRGEFASFAVETGQRSANDCGDLNKESKDDRSWQSPGFKQDDQHPVVCVTWYDANAYVSWLARKTGKPYRLLSEAEREYVARAGSTTPFWWGTSITPSQANYDGRTIYKGGGLKGENRKQTVPVNSFTPNRWGLYNVHGNTEDWTLDCWSVTHQGSPVDGGARTQGNCDDRVTKGGSWYLDPKDLRSASRVGGPASVRVNDIGFRVARDLTP